MPTRLTRFTRHPVLGAAATITTFLLSAGTAAAAQAAQQPSGGGGNKPGQQGQPAVDLINNITTQGLKILGTIFTLIVGYEVVKHVRLRSFAAIAATVALGVIAAYFILAPVTAQNTLKETALSLMP